MEKTLFIHHQHGGEGKDSIQKIIDIDISDRQGDRWTGYDSQVDLLEYIPTTSIKLDI